MDKIREEAASSLKRAAETMKHFYDRKRTDSRDYKVGDQVYVEATNISTMRPAKKLDDKRYGPFEIIEKVGLSSYKLKLPDTWKIHPVFNEALLTPYHPPEFPTQEKPPPPPPIQVPEGHVEYEVNEVLGSRRRRKKVEYLVSWKGYPNEENSWQPMRNLKNAREAILEFHKKYPKAIKPKTLRIIHIYTTLYPNSLQTGIRASNHEDMILNRGVMS